MFLKSNAMRRLAAVALHGPGHLAAQRTLGWLRGGFILAYHNLPPERFRKQVKALEPCRPVALDEVAARAATGRSTAGLFAITFDDGVGATVREISTVCLEEGWPVTFYLPTAYLDGSDGMPFQWMTAVAPHLRGRRLELRGGTLDLRADGAAESLLRRIETQMHTEPQSVYAPLLKELCEFAVSSGVTDAEELRAPEPITWQEVTHLAADGMISFESHGVSHASLSSMSDEELDRELVTSRDEISARTGRPCRHFCYPFGNAAAIGPRAAERVARVYETGTTMTRGRIRGHRLSLLPRIPVYAQDTPEIVRLKTVTV